MRVRCPQCHVERETVDFAVTATCFGCGCLFPARKHVCTGAAPVVPQPPVPSTDDPVLPPPVQMEKPVSIQEPTADAEPKRGTPPATDRQLAFLHSLGAEVPADLNVRQASELIDRLKKEQRRDLMAADAVSVKQIQYILKMGGQPWNGMSKLEASQLIAWLQEYEIEHELTCAKCGGFRGAGESKCSTCGGFLKSITIEHPDREQLPIWAAGRAET